MDPDDRSGSGDDVCSRSASPAERWGVDRWRAPGRTRWLGGFIAALGLLLFVAQDVSAQGGSGKAETKNWEFEIVSAFVFPADRLLGEGRGLLVALSNVAIDETKMAGWFDRRGAIDKFFSDPENSNLVLLLGLMPDGRQDGFSWYFGNGDGCSLCRYTGITSTLQRKGDRLVGALHGVERDNGELSLKLDLEIDARIQAETPGKPLPADGGEPGKAYRQLSTALHESGWAGVDLWLDAEWHEIVASNSPEDNEQLASNLASKVLQKDSRVVGGFLQGDRALLQVIAEGDIKYRCETKLHREGGAWRYDDSWCAMVFE